MSVSENLQDIIAKQKAVLAELEEEANLIIGSNLTVENELLKKEVEKLSEALAKEKEQTKNISAKNAELKNALFEQVYSEKLQILNAARKKNDIYFKNNISGELNHLAALEKDLTGKIKRLENELTKHRVESSQDIYKQLGALSLHVNETVTTARAKIARETGAFSMESGIEFERLKSEQITDETMQELGRKNNLEAFVGGNLINKLGVLFVLLGIIAVSRFSFFYLPDTFKGIIMFVVSAGFLAAGELLSRKKANIFSLGITSGGVAGLYASLSISYFVLNILSMYPAILLCVLITAGAFVLSRRYNSQTIAAFALAGGYIPIVSVYESAALMYGAMIYFVVLNLLALTFSYYKKWKIAMFIGYFLNLAGTLYIAFGMMMSQPYDKASGIHELSTILYIMFAFAIYTVIPVLSNYRAKQHFSKSDTVILGLNTLFSALIMYMTFYAFNLSQFNGIMAIAFAAVYIYLGRFIETRFEKEKSTLALFYLTGLTFVVLVIPFQFGRAWLSLGWLAQGVSLSVYGILTGEKNFKRAGFAIGGLCLWAFLFFDAFLSIDDLFAYKYLAITLGSAAILAAYAYKKSLAGLFEKIYKYAALVNIWFYSLYLIGLPGDFLRNKMEYSAYNFAFLEGAMFAAATFLIASVLPRIPAISDKGVKIISVAISLLGMLGVMQITSADNIMSLHMVDGYYTPMPISFLAGLALFALCGLAVLAMKNVLMFFVIETRLPVEWLPFGLSAYFLVILTQNLVMQYGLYFTSIVISIIYVVAALAWIIYGFVKRFAFMRRFGLGLSVLAVAKLFLVDLPDLTQGYKIITYFAFGVTLLGISFVYQYFSKRLVPKEGGAEHVKEDIE